MKEDGSIYYFYRMVVRISEILYGKYGQKYFGIDGIIGREVTDGRIRS
jgi:hypothetical protein